MILCPVCLSPPSLPSPVPFRFGLGCRCGCLRAWPLRKFTLGFGPDPPWHSVIFRPWDGKTFARVPGSGLVEVPPGLLPSLCEAMLDACLASSVLDS